MFFAKAELSKKAVSKAGKLRESSLSPPSSLFRDGLGPTGHRLLALPTLGLRPRGLRPLGLRPRGLRPRGLRPRGLRPFGLLPRGLRPRGLRHAGLRPAGLRPLLPFVVPADFPPIISANLCLTTSILEMASVFVAEAETDVAPVFLAEAETDVEAEAGEKDGDCGSGCGFILQRLFRCSFCLCSMFPECLEQMKLSFSESHFKNLLAFFSTSFFFCHNGGDGFLDMSRWVPPQLLEFL